MGKRVITINRMYGSNGRQIGKALAEELGIPFYDRELIEMASKERGIPYNELAKVDEKKASQWRFAVEHEVQIDESYHFIPMNDVLYDTQRNLILDIANREDCVIVGRCANYILRDKALCVFIYAPFENRVKTVMERTDREEKSAVKLVRRVDKERRLYYEYFTEEPWMDPSGYDLCLDSSRFSQEQILKIIQAAI